MPITQRLSTTDRYECRVNGAWVKVSHYIFRSWTGARRLNGDAYYGPVFTLGTTERAGQK